MGIQAMREHFMQAAIRRAIIISALGYFVDIFDIQLFGILRIPSLTELGVPADQLAIIGGHILNAQMLGMIMGAFLWGWLGDRFGRLKGLYGSIIVYSLGTLACSIVHDPMTYGICRFVTGFGLAGETGIAVTLIAELMSPQKRGWGISVVGGIGASGPILALVLAWFLPWRTTYVAAGIIGLVILILRIKLVEPELFEKIRDKEKNRGSLRLLLQPRQLLIFLSCFAIGLPTIYAVNLLNFFSQEISRSVLRAENIFDQKVCMLLFFIGLGLGAFALVILSQLIHSRRKAMIYSLFMGIMVCIAYLLASPIIKISPTIMYGVNFCLGLTLSGLSLVTLITAEQFGTNIRATSTALLTNAIRAGVIPMIFAFQNLKATIGVPYAASLIGAIIFIAAFLGLSQLRETHGLDLDYVEKIGNKASRT